MSVKTKRDVLIAGVIAVALAAVFCCIAFSTAAYAQSAGVRTTNDPAAECAAGGSGSGDCIVCDE